MWSSGVHEIQCACINLWEPLIWHIYVTEGIEKVAWEVFSEKNKGSWVSSEGPEDLEMIGGSAPEWSMWS